MSDLTAELSRREQRAQQGIVQFAEEMQAIRDRNLYPDAGQAEDAWKRYCAARWSLSSNRINKIIQAAPVIARYRERSESELSVEKASAVASLPDAVQDAILTSDPKAVAEDDVKAKAKAARKVKKQAETEGRDATDDEIIAATANVKSTRPKPTHRKKSSKFTSALEQAYYYVELAADVAQGDTLSDVENDYGWNRVAKVKYQLGRIEERLYRPEIVKDADEEFAELLSGGDES